MVSTTSMARTETIEGRPSSESPKVNLINLPIIHLTGDPYGSIPFIHAGLAYLAGYLRSNGIDVSIIDGYGLDPAREYRIDDSLSAFGLTEDEIIARIPGSPTLIGITVHSGMSHSFAMRLAQRIKDRFPACILIAGGHHASVLYQDFLDNGFDYVCIGEGEQPLLGLVQYLQKGEGQLEHIDGLAWQGHEPTPQVFEKDLDKLGFAALDLFPLEQYWALRMSHAPVRGPYMVLTASRGCPYACRFCTTPALLRRQWRKRSPGHVADEIENAVKTLGIEDVIIQDEAFGVIRENALGIAHEIQRRQLPIRLFLPSGVKIERLDEEVLTELRKAGLVHMCLAPESGSARVLKKMNKPLDFDYMFKMVACARRLGIRMSAFFVLGFEDEDDADRAQTEALVAKLTRMGVDEVSLFIWTPLPGADAFTREGGWTRYEDLNWTPTWRKDYPELSRFRNRLYRKWAMTKILFYPLDSLRLALHVLTGRYELKSEMALRRVLIHRLRKLGLCKVR